MTALFPATHLGMAFLESRPPKISFANASKTLGGKFKLPRSAAMLPGSTEFFS